MRLHLQLFVGALLAGLAAVPRGAVPEDTSGYWQQEVRYLVRARLDESTATLSAQETITYINRSPDTLTEFYLHLYLNAFRPGSRWADRDSMEGRRRFNDLREPNYAFERIASSTVNGIAVTPEYPYAPDSTIVRLRLPRPQPPGDSIEVAVRWNARLSTVARRQGRLGRRYDFAQWYPRVVVYDRSGWQDHPLFPAGEFYGEFATYDVTLDLPEDQVVGATGVPVEGDPGWEGARAGPDVRVDHQRNWYGSRTPKPGRCGAVDPGRKCVRFYAEGVHDFAWSVNPGYVYEQGRFKDIIVRVLYLRGEQDTWGNGVAVGRTVESLRWLDELFGPYPWPQLTNLHRIDGGGTEFPMVIMNGGASMGLILHETGHQYLMGILANNEWKHGFLDEGFTSFQASWYNETLGGFDAYPRVAASMLQLDLDGWSQPINTPGEDFRDFATYSRMTYSKAQLMYLQLRYVVGYDAMRGILREYYRRWRLKHVTPEAFRDVAEDVSGMDLGWFFDQWLNSVTEYDYAIGDVERRRLPDGSWETSVEVKRKADGRMPVEIGERHRPVIYARALGKESEEVVTFRTNRAPGRLMLDPRVMSYDWNFTNNREQGLLDFGDAKFRWDTFFSEPAARDRRVISIAPTFWRNDASDATVGIRVRSNYMGRYDRTTLWLIRGVSGFEQATSGDVLDIYFKLENPLFLRDPRASQSLELWSQEGTVGARLEFSKAHRRSMSSPNVRNSGWTAQWVATRQTNFLDDALWENGGTVEIGRFDDWRFTVWGSRSRVRLDYRAGLTYSKPPRGNTTDPEPFARIIGSASIRKPIAGFVVGVRAFAGGYLADDPPILQRRIPLNGADPYETLRNPFVRTQGSLLGGTDIIYHSPGNGNLRGFRPGIGGRWMVGGSVEVEKTVVRRDRGIFRSAAVTVFGDGALVDTLAVRSTFGNGATPVSDAGVGARFGLRIGDISFPVRIEFPFFVSEPNLAHERIPGGERLSFRWLISFQPTF